MNDNLIKIILAIAISAITGLTGYIFNLRATVATLEEEAKVSAARDDDQYKKFDGIGQHLLNESIKDRDYWRQLYFKCRDK